MLAAKRATVTTLLLSASSLILLGTSVFKTQALFFWSTSLILVLAAIVIALQEHTHPSYLRIIVYVLLAAIIYNMLLFLVFSFL